MTRRSLWTLLALIVIASAALPVLAQDAPDTAPPIGAPGVSYDEVNAVAERMYCPECENVPLDKCLTPVCMQWKGEIADQLAAGQNADQIYAWFRERFGDQVLAVPDDPLLRALSLVAPYVLAAVMLLLGVITFFRLRGREADEDALQTMPAGAAAENDPYRSRLERDLNG